MTEVAILSHEDFRQALDFFQAGNFEVAGVFFGDLLESEAFHDDEVRICRSWLGLSQVLDGDKDGVVHCRIAAKDGKPPLQVFVNLARAELELGHRDKLMIALENGLSHYPDSQALNDLHDKYERRTPPAVKFLGRNNPINRALGAVKKRR
ncbi:MAG: hypothetical protein R3312_00060 [Gammaproteobacteria bacterium]|nr:hypothetical protein [Gammaproteobacteria bacterium]